MTMARREQKRAARTMPPALEQSWRARVGAVLALCVTLCVWLFLRSGYYVWLVIALPASALLVVMMAATVYERWLLMRAQVSFGRRGIRCLIVHSQSPVWKDRIATEWLPRLAAVAATLDWSQRARWGRTLEVELFHRFCSGERNFNPAVIVFRGFKRPYVYRFFEAFRAAKHGQDRYLRQLEQQMFDSVRSD
jgi:hypothetical protein